MYSFIIDVQQASGFGLIPSRFPQYMSKDFPLNDDDPALHDFFEGKTFIGHVLNFLIASWGRKGKFGGYTIDPHVLLGDHIVCQKNRAADHGTELPNISGPVAGEQSIDRSLRKALHVL